MNTTIKLSISGALAFGAAAAHASIALPSSGSSDAILFAEVLNAAQTKVVASYAGDTGVSINALIAGIPSSTTVLGSDSNLAALFTADTGSDVIEWAVEGGQYTGNANAPTFGPSGAAQFITTSINGSTNKLVNETTTNLVVWGKLTATVSTINSNSNGASSIEAGSASSGGVWDYTDTSTNSDWFKNGPVTGNLLGGAQTLFYVTGGGTSNGSNTKIAYSALSTTAQLTQSGLELAVSGGGGGTPPVPLPAAVWLLGSGLLGLAGVARRKLTV